MYIYIFKYNMCVYMHMSSIQYQTSHKNPNCFLQCDCDYYLKIVNLLNIPKFIKLIYIKAQYYRMK